MKAAVNFVLTLNDEDLKKASVNGGLIIPMPANTETITVKYEKQAEKTS